MSTSIKKRIFISATPAAAKTLVGYTALTYIQIKKVETIGQIGFNHETITVGELETGINSTLKGARSGTAGQVAFRTLAADPGQVAVAAANEAETEVSIQIVNPDGTTATFWTGIIHSLLDNEASSSTYEGSTFQFVPNYAPIKGAAKLPV